MIYAGPFPVSEVIPVYICMTCQIKKELFATIVQRYCLI